MRLAGDSYPVPLTGTSTTAVAPPGRFVLDVYFGTPPSRSSRYLSRRSVALQPRFAATARQSIRYSTWR